MSRTAAPSASFAAPRLRLASRIAAAVLGGYAFAWGTVAAVTAALFAADLEFHDAEFLGAVAGLLAYLVAFLWAIAARRLARVWAVLLGAGALMAAGASYVQSLLA
ncbi:iron uptake protein [Xanthomonas sp. AmX2]|uniref:iron uptake protein n=1 Tax=Xanthomonas sp. TaxID=29446 RepID=UPI001980C725|nr:iron uptake protein [Xanthomonas sp.]MBN6151587.1 iron uptake protein [Xanthomonas sp.]